MRKLSFFTVPFWFDTFFVCGRPGLCVVLGCGASVGRYVNLVLLLLSISLFIHDFTVLARQVLIQRSSSSRAHSKRVTNKTIFDVYVPLIVHVLLLTHEFMNDNICLPHSWHPKWNSLCFHVPKAHMMNFPLWCNAVGCWSWQKLDCFYRFCSVLQCHKQRCAFFPFPRFFCRCYKCASLVLQQQCNLTLPYLTLPYNNNYHNFYMFNPRSLAVCFWLLALSVNSVTLLASCIILSLLYTSKSPKQLLWRPPTKPQFFLGLQVPPIR